MIVTIDGPTASGKSTVARLLAHELGYYYLASGLLFRALAYLLVKEKGYTSILLASPHEADIIQYLNSSDFMYTYDSIQQEQIYYKNRQLTFHLKTPEIDQAASILSTNALVREHFMRMQRRIAEQHDIVADGRDCGSVVFPDADVKFYLTAANTVRAKRWFEDQKKKGLTFSLEQAEQGIEARDRRDMSREVAPLKVPDNAIILDNSVHNLHEMAMVMKSYVEKKEKERSEVPLSF